MTAPSSLNQEDRMESLTYIVVQQNNKSAKQHVREKKENQSQHSLPEQDNIQKE